MRTLLLKSAPYKGIKSVFFLCSGSLLWPACWEGSPQHVGSIKKSSCGLQHWQSLWSLWVRVFWRTPTKQNAEPQLTSPSRPQRGRSLDPDRHYLVQYIAYQLLYLHPCDTNWGFHSLLLSSHNGTLGLRNIQSCQQVKKMNNRKSPQLPLLHPGSGF